MASFNIPQNITVHLGKPDQKAENLTIPFRDYIKNVASSEIYPTWPENAIRANVYAIVTFALNRIYTEWYPSRGYDFDVTNSTQYDQAFVKDREIFENISNIVDELFDDYVIKQGSVEPYFTQYCNGTTALCNGLSQWGTVELSRQGKSPYEILQYYYGDNINIMKNIPVNDSDSEGGSYPGTPVQLGDFGNYVVVIQRQLNRIAKNYPAIPRVEENSIFDVKTQTAVKKFQEVFNLPVTGVVDKATWYEIKKYYIGVKKLSELASEGITIGEATLPYTNQLQIGMVGEDIRALQYYLTALAYFNSDLIALELDGVFGENTENAVTFFQQYYGLPQTGAVDKATWDKISQMYKAAVGTIKENSLVAAPYPGYILTIGEKGDNVARLQSYLAVLGENIKELPIIPITGYFGEQTRDAVLTFQRLYGLPQIGAVGPLTWLYIGKEYDRIMGEKKA